MIKINLQDGRTVKANPSILNGTYKLKDNLGAGLQFFKFGGNVGYGIYNNTADPIMFRNIEVSNMTVVPYPGAEQKVGYLDYIPFNKDHFRNSPKVSESSHSHFIAPDEIIPIITDFEVFSPPSGPERIQISKTLKQEIDFSVFKEGRVGSLLEQYSAKPKPKHATGNQRNLNWLMDNWQHRHGGEPREGWFKRLSFRGGDGYDNGHYYKCAWIFHNYLHNPNEPAETFYMGMSTAINLVCQGRAHRGKYKGMSYYEKSDAFYGDAFNPAWEKQFGWNMFLPDMIPGKAKHIFKPFVDDYLDQLSTVSAKDIFQGYWGVRKGRYAGEEFLAAYYSTGEQIFFDQLVELLNDVYGHYNQALGFWENHGSPSTVSPWMQFEMIGLMFRCIEKVPGLVDKLNFGNNKLLEMFDRLYFLGMHEFKIKQFDGKMKVCTYRINPQVISNCNIHRNGSVYTPLKYAAALDPVLWGNEFEDFKAKLNYYAGSPLWKISPDYEATFKPGFNKQYGKGYFDAWPIWEIGFDFPTEGLAFEKAIANYMRMCL